MSGELHVVLGASGGLGRTLVETLASQGRRVRAVSRSVPNRNAGGPVPGVEFVAADITNRPMRCERAKALPSSSTPPSPRTGSGRSSSRR